MMFGARMNRIEGFGHQEVRVHEFVREMSPFSNANCQKFYLIIKQIKDEFKSIAHGPYFNSIK